MMKQNRTSTNFKLNKRSPVGFQKPPGSKRAAALQQMQFLRYIQKKEKSVHASVMSTQPAANRPPHLEMAKILQKVYKKAFQERMIENTYESYNIRNLQSSIKENQSTLRFLQSLGWLTSFWDELRKQRLKARIKADSLRVTKLQEQERLEEQEFEEMMARHDEKIARSKANMKEFAEKYRLYLEESSQLEKEEKSLESMSEEELQIVQTQERKEIQEQYDEELQLAYEEAFQKQASMITASMAEHLVYRWKTLCEESITYNLRIRPECMKYGYTALDIEMRIVKNEAEIDVCIVRLEQLEEKALLRALQLRNRELQRRPFLEKWGKPWEWENPFEDWREWMQLEPVMVFFDVMPSLAITPL